MGKNGVWRTHRLKILNFLHMKAVLSSIYISMGSGRSDRFWTVAEIGEKASFFHNRTESSASKNQNEERIGVGHPRLHPQNAPRSYRQTGIGCWRRSSFLPPIARYTPPAVIPFSAIAWIRLDFCRPSMVSEGKSANIVPIPCQVLDALIIFPRCCRRP